MDVLLRPSVIHISVTILMEERHSRNRKLSAAGILGAAVESLIARSKNRAPHRHLVN